MKKTQPNYFLILIKKYPEILGGRKNYNKGNSRVAKGLKLTKKYFLKKN